jgi:hypothetical protein
VATDQKTSLIDAGTDQAAPAIENELPAYRAISKLAVSSVIFGFLALFSFAHWFFYLFALLALVAGVAANYKIKHYPDMLTGNGLASAGIALGLVFGLSAGTIAMVQNYIRTREAERFAKQIAAALKAPNAGEAMWWTLYPDMRKDKNPTQYLHEVESAKGKERMMHEQRFGALNKIHKRLTSGPREDIHFLKIESSGIDDGRGLELGVYAVALFELEGPGSADYPEKREYAAILLKARTTGSRYEWWVDTFIYPYKESSFVPPEKPADDGHGHSHAH